MCTSSRSPVVLAGRALSVFLAAASSAALVVACTPVVVVGGGGGGDSASEGASEVPGFGEGVNGDEETGSGGDFALSCGFVSGECSSDQYPAGETCEECFCRCCNVADLMTQCQGEPACMDYVECLIACDGDPACVGGCNLPCPTGAEAACYLEDCRNWVCAHTCGEYP